jgi:hypothetical protein
MFHLLSGANDEPPSTNNGDYVFAYVKQRERFARKYGISLDSSGSALMLGLPLAVAYRDRRAPYSLKNVDRILGSCPERKASLREMDLAIANAAIAYALHSSFNHASFSGRLRSELNDVRYASADFKYARKLGTRRPFQQVATHAVDMAQQTLLYQYLNGDRLTDPDNLCFVASCIGQSLMSGAEVLADDRQH